MAENKKLVELKNLTKIYKKSHLGKVKESTGVKDLSLDIQDGEIFALLGLNGAGKTTTFKLILGLLFPTEGEILIEGSPMPNPELIQKVGYLPEIPYFPAHLTVSEVLKYYGTLSQIPPSEINARVEAVLKTVKMQDRKEVRIRECSKGMLQRVSLAQSLIHAPSLLVLDEPITGLDPLGLSEMRQMILDLNRDGKTILFSSHMIAEVEKIAHRAAILVNGKLARTLSAAEWNLEKGLLEKIFVETVQASTSFV